MKIARMILPAALTGLMVLGGAAPSMARRGDDRDTRDNYYYYNTRSSRDLRDILRDYSFEQNAWDLLDLLHLDRGQRAKIRELVGKYNVRIRDIARDDSIPPSRRRDKIQDSRRELRDRVLHVLTREQRATVEDMLSRYRDRRDRNDRYDRRDRNDNNNDYQWWRDLD